MSGRRLPDVDIHEIVRLKRAGHNNSEISRSVGCRRKTVRAHVKWAAEQGLLEGEALSVEELHQLLEATKPRHQPPEQKSSVAKYDKQIRALRAKGTEIAAIKQRIEEEKKVQISYEALRRYVRRLEPPEPEAYVRVEVDPGDEAQVDFGLAPLLTLDEKGRKRKTWVFVMTLSHSRHQYAELVYDQTVETWLACHQRAFEFFGGAPRRVVPDNLKSAIIRACWNDPLAQRSYRELSEHYGFLIAPQPPREPHLKGKVEKGGVGYVKRNFLAGRDPVPTSELNEKLRQWCLTTAGLRDHGTTHKQPLAVFESVEKDALVPLPKTRYDMGVWKSVKLHRDCYVNFEKAYYSAPFRLVGQQLMLRGGLESVRIYTRDHELVATHDRAWEPGERLTNLDHLPPHKVPGLTVTRETCRLKAKQMGPATSTVVESLLESRPIDKLRTAGRVLELASRFSAPRLERACARALYYGEADLRTIRSILQTGKDHDHLPGIDPPRPVTQQVFTFARSVGEFVSALKGAHS